MKAFGFLVLSLMALFYVSALKSTQSTPMRNAEVLAYPDTQKLVLIRGVFDAFGHIAYQTNPAQARCIWGWLHTSAKARQAFLLEYFASKPEENVARVIFILLKKDCQFSVSGLLQ